MKSIIKLEPFYSPKVWGYEEWVLSTHKNGNSIVHSNKQTLSEVLGKELPILIKVIQANDKLSVQVHPDNEYSIRNENDNGKTECWYILDAKPDASLICGIKKGLSRKTLHTIIKQGNIEEYLERINIKKGDMIYIPSGTVHAIEGGVKILEIQQSSDITYRIYDWGRDRETHIEKSLDVIDYKCENKAGKIENFKKLETPYFTVEKIEVNGEYNDKSDTDVCSYTVISGEGKIIWEDYCEELNEGTIYIKKGTIYKIQGKLQLIKSYV